MIKLECGDIIKMKKKHPCGSDEWAWCRGEKTIPAVRQCAGNRALGGYFRRDALERGTVFVCGHFRSATRVAAGENRLFVCARSGTYRGECDGGCAQRDRLAGLCLPAHSGRCCSDGAAVCGGSVCGSAGEKGRSAAGRGENVCCLKP